MKKLGILRFGVFGDMIIVSPVFRYLKKQGWHITAETTRMGEQILRHNPFIDEIYIQEDKMNNREELFKFADERAKLYDKHINLSYSIEQSLAVVPWHDIYKAPREEREARCNVNYYDRTAELCGIEERGLRGEVFFTQLENKFALDFRKKHKGSYIVLWAMSGSSIHKAYPYADEVAFSFLHKHPDALIVTVGDELCELIEWEHPRTINKSGKWTIRKSMVMAKYADLVIGPDTGMMHSAGCFDTPKILLNTAASPKNLSEHWINCVNLSANLYCQPCYRLLYNIDICPKDKSYGTSLCIAGLKPEVVFEAMDKEYYKRREHASYNMVRESCVHAG